MSLTYKSSDWKEWTRALVEKDSEISGTQRSDRRAVTSGPLSVGPRTTKAARRTRGGKRYVYQL